MFCQSKSYDWLATSPQALLKYQRLKNIQYELARYIATGSFQVYKFQINLDRMARHLATRGFGIHILPGQHRLNGSPRRYKGFLKIICQSLSQDWLATSPQALFEYLCLVNSQFELARYVATSLRRYVTGIFKALTQIEWLATSLQRLFEFICFQVSLD